MIPETKDIVINFLELFKNEDLFNKKKQVLMFNYQISSNIELQKALIEMIKYLLI